MKVLVSAIKDEAGCCRLSTIRNASAWPVLLEQRERGLGATLLSVPQPRQAQFCLHFTLSQDKLGIGSLLGACAGGSSSNSTNINGNWTAVLSDPDGCRVHDVP